MTLPQSIVFSTLAACITALAIAVSARGDDWICTRCDPPTATFEWTPSGGSPDGYEIWAILDGDPPILYTFTIVPRCDASWTTGELKLQVRAVKGEKRGPWSPVSKPERLWVNYDLNGDTVVDFTDFRLGLRLPEMFGRRIVGGGYVK